MPLAFLTYPNIDPIAIEFGPFSIKWYGIAYLAGLVLGWWYVRGLIANASLWRDGKAPLTREQTDDLLLWVTLAIIVGGRLGQVLLYDPGYYFQNPGEILKTWRGGMSFHGALLASGIALVLFARKFRIPALSVMDLCCAAVPFGLLFGRLANFINSEHFGRVSDVAWAFIFPTGGELPRHPSQLYEAALEGIVMFALLRFMTHSKLALKTPGLVTGAWLVWYWAARSICEFFREPENVHALNIGPFTAGQLYSLPMLMLGLYLISRATGLRSPGKAKT